MNDDLCLVSRLCRKDGGDDDGDGDGEGEGEGGNDEAEKEAEGDEASEPLEKEGFDSLAPEDVGEEEGEDLEEDEQQPEVRQGPQRLRAHCDQLRLSLRLGFIMLYRKTAFF